MTPRDEHFTAPCITGSVVGIHPVDDFLDRHKATCPARKTVIAELSGTRLQYVRNY